MKFQRQKDAQFPVSILKSLQLEASVHLRLAPKLVSTDTSLMLQSPECFPRHVFTMNSYLKYTNTQRYGWLK